MRTLVLLSGGMDSATLLAQALYAKHERVGVLSVHYGQKHRRELDSARAVALYYGLDHTTLDIGFLSGSIFLGSSQTDPSVAVPKGRYDEPSMKKTVVPNRNMIFLAIAGAYALSHGFDTVAYAAHAGDHTIYPDCRPVFVDAMLRALRLCDWNPLELWTPFLTLSKADIAKHGIMLHVPYEKTWTCYEGGEVACGKCGSCSERLEAFADAGVKDPIPYAP